MATVDSGESDWPGFIAASYRRYRSVEKSELLKFANVYVVHFVKSLSSGPRTVVYRAK